MPAENQMKPFGQRARICVLKLIFRWGNMRERNINVVFRHRFAGGARFTQPLQVVFCKIDLVFVLRIQHI